MKFSFSTDPAKPKTWRMAVIPALTLVLAGVLFWPKADSAAEATPTANETTLVSSRKQSSPTQASDENRWPTFEIDQVVAFDPFDPFPPAAVELPANPSSSGEPQQADSNTSTSNPSALGKLQAIYRDTHGTVAIFESRVIHVGDVLPDGGRVIAIEAGEIVVTKP
jgi:hypothetical protein